MLKLIENEWCKNFFRLRNYLSLGLIIILSIVSCLFPLMFETEYQKEFSGENWSKEAENWIQTLDKKIAPIENKIEAKQSEKANNSDELFSLEAQKREITEEINRLNYYLSNDIRPVIPNNLYKNLLSVTEMQGIFVVLGIILAVSMISDEFSKGTIKLLLIRPVSRYKILLSKLLSLLMYIVFYISIACFSTFLISLMTSDINKTMDYIYSIDINTFKHVNFFLVFFQNSSLLIFSVFIISFLSFCLAILFRSKSLAISLSLVIFFFSGVIVSSLFEYSNLTKYLWFANWELNNYIVPLKHRSIVLGEGMNLTHSLLINLVYLIIFLILTFRLFKNREIFD